MPQKSVVALFGCVHGIGRSIVDLLSKRDVVLGLADIDAPGLRNVEKELKVRDIECLAREVDIVSREKVDTFVQDLLKQYGRIDTVICNAGGVVSLVANGQLETQWTPFAESNPDDWKKIIDLNLYGVLNSLHAVVPTLRKQGHGRIVVVSSMSGLSGGVGLSLYSAAKGGVIAFMKALAKELAPAGIPVNSIAPGGVLTRAFVAGSAAAKQRAEGIAMGRLGQPEEIANTVIYLALDAPTYLTGQVIAVSGGPI